MANIVKLKRSNTAGVVPTTANLADGEVAINTADKKIYARAGSSVIEIFSGDAAATLTNYAALRAYNGAKTVVQLTADGIAGVFVYQSSDTTSADDGGIVIVGADNRRWARQYDGKVNVLWFGAKAGDDSASVADANTIAFRAANLSMKSVWTAYSAKYKKGRSVFAPAGDYNLSNGFTVPKGCSFEGGGVGDARFKVLGATADANPKLPVISLGRCINDSTLQTEITAGAYVQDPPPSVGNVYLNPQNSGIGLDITGIPGFKVGDIWAQAATGIRIGGGSGDGIFGKLFLEDSTGYGVDLGDCQNITLPTIYTFVCNNPVVVTGNCNNIDIGILQANYTKVAVLQTNDGVVAGRINIGKLVCNQNEQYPTFVSPVRTRSNYCDIFIGDMDARNYSGFAIDNETGLGNIVEVNRLRLRQAPNKSSYTLGTSARGVRVSNQQVRIGYADIEGLATSPFEFVGSIAQSLRIEGGNIGSFGGTGKLINITGVAGEISVRDLNNNSGIGLFNHQQYVAPVWRDVINPFPVVTEGGRKAIKIPFCAKGSAFNVTICANTGPGGNANYRRTKKLWVTQETGYEAKVVTNIYAGVLGNSGLTTGFTPDITHQVDLNTVGGSAQAAMVQSGEVVVSVPSSYDSVSFAVSQEL